MPSGKMTWFSQEGAEETEKGNSRNCLGLSVSSDRSGACWGCLGFGLTA